MSTYVMSDIHGHCLEFIKMLEQIKFRKEDTLYILGDVIDKGEDSIALLKIINMSKNIFLLKGNHEAMMLSYLQNKDIDNLWFLNGGNKTLLEYNNLTKKDKIKIYNMLYHLPVYKELDINHRHYFLSHSGMIINNKYNLKELIELNNKEEFYYWISNEDLFLNVDLDYLNTTFIFGHTAVHTLSEYIEIDDVNKKRIKENKIYLTKSKIDMDIGSAYSKGLACLRLEDFEEFYIRY